ncbi:MAG TPA: trypsin-like peptidase domain-containing protein [Thermoanaerobaculia bacterium]|nr:trypsin-like peptidase domain-containing protein [Thermoanaerobaculia bacterium]
MSNETQNPAIELSELLATTVETAGGSVVQVSARRGMGSSGVVWSGDGLIVAAAHNIEREEDITVSLADGSTAPAKLVGRDPSTDVAVLRAEASGLAVPEWSDLSGLKVGHLVLNLLRPGRSVRALLGIVGTLSREEWRTPAGGRLDLYLHAAVDIQKGSSGSLLVDVAGRALALGTAGLQRGHLLGIPSATLKRTVESLLAHGGRIPRGYLGLALVPVRLPASVEESAGQTVGLMVAGVQPGSSAETAGILLGDVLISLDDEPVSDLGQLHGLLSAERIGQESVLRLVRAGEVREVRVTIGSR